MEVDRQGLDHLQVAFVDEVEIVDRVLCQVDPSARHAPSLDSVHHESELEVDDGSEDRNLLRYHVELQAKRMDVGPHAFEFPVHARLLPYRRS